jgi:phosphotransferase system enzyme I (PtsI)
LVLEDPLFAQEIPEAIVSRRLNAEFLLNEGLGKFRAILAGLEDPYFRERGGDVEDVGHRVLKNLTGSEKDPLKELDREVVLVAPDLSPSDTVGLDPKTVKGFATDIGGRTSHVAIVARSLGLPAVVGMGDLTSVVQDGDVVIVDGNEGRIILNPDPRTLKQYRKEKENYEAFYRSLEALRHLPARTPDGREVVLAGNIEIPQEVDDLLAHGAHGVGLFRTEFLFLDRESLPDEEEQFGIYREVAHKMGKYPAIVRTLDLGGDKFLNQVTMHEERNPFLGLRAIRLCLKRPEMFKTQLRAILRASAFGPLRIMFPMICSMQELREAKRYVAECMEELKREKHKFNPAIEIGAMIEIPSAAVMADFLAEECDFLSVGTNDLIQYTLAVDRVNEAVAYLYDPLNPAVIRLIHQTIEACHKHKKWAGMCGEMAGDPKFAPLLLGLGLDEFSVSASVIPEVKKVIRMMPYALAQEIAAEALKMRTSQEILALLKERIPAELRNILF